MTANTKAEPKHWLLLGASWHFIEHSNEPAPGFSHPLWTGSYVPPEASQQSLTHCFTASDSAKHELVSRTRTIRIADRMISTSYLMDYQNLIRIRICIKKAIEKKENIDSRII